MIQTWPQRLETERRLLAALYLWPRPVDLDGGCFLAPEHGVLFDAIQEAGPDLADDYKAIPVLVGVVRRNRRLTMFKAVKGVEEYVITQLVPIDVREREIPSLIESVKACPRCGR